MLAIRTCRCSRVSPFVRANGITHAYRYLYVVVIVAAAFVVLVVPKNVHSTYALIHFCIRVFVLFLAGLCGSPVDLECAATKLYAKAIKSTATRDIILGSSSAARKAIAALALALALALTLALTLAPTLAPTLTLTRRFFGEWVSRSLWIVTTTTTSWASARPPQVVMRVRW